MIFKFTVPLLDERRIYELLLVNEMKMRTIDLCNLMLFGVSLGKFLTNYFDKLSDDFFDKFCDAFFLQIFLTDFFDDFFY